MARELIPLTDDERTELLPFLKQFALSGEPSEVVRLKQGHLHDTFIASWDGHPEERFLHQRINQVAFPRTNEMLQNIVQVVEYLIGEAADSFPQHLQLIQTASGEPFLESNGEYWRTYGFIEESESHDTCPSPAHGKALGEASARFIALLSELNPDQLIEHQPNFQDTDVRVEQLKSIWKIADEDRKESAKDLYELILTQQENAAVISRALREGKLPTRCIHFDTKVNNFLFRESTDEVLCLVDLDLCMPGTALYDFGDLVRSASSRGREDERDLSQVGVDEGIIAAITEGFIGLDELELSPEECRLLPDAPFAISLNLTSRFLTDYLAGDQYFPVSQPHHNLDRAKAQWRVSQELREKRGVIAKIVHDPQG